jgi:hypothetical protein
MNKEIMTRKLKITYWVDGPNMSDDEFNNQHTREILLDMEDILRFIKEKDGDVSGEYVIFEGSVDAEFVC